MLTKILRAIAAIFVAMVCTLIPIGGVSAGGEVTLNGVTVNEDSCEVRQVEYSVQHGAQTRWLAGVYVGESDSGRCYSLVINYVVGPEIAGVIVWGSTSEKGGFSRTFTATVRDWKFTFTPDPIFGFSTTYKAEVRGRWHVYTIYTNKNCGVEGSCWFDGINTRRYIGETRYGGSEQLVAN